MPHAVGRIVGLAHGARGQSRPRLPREPDAGVQPVAQRFGIGERQGDQCRWNVARRALEHQANGLEAGTNANTGLSGKVLVGAMIRPSFGESGFVVGDGWPGRPYV